MVPAGLATVKRFANLSMRDSMRQSRTGSGLARRMESCVGRPKVYPTNVLHLATETHNRYHSAAFPAELPSWFIRLFTLQGDVVLAPFMGSGTTAVASLSLKRQFVGIEREPKFVRIANERLAKLKAFQSSTQAGADGSCEPVHHRIVIVRR